MKLLDLIDSLPPATGKTAVADPSPEPKSRAGQQTDLAAEIEPIDTPMPDNFRFESKNHGTEYPGMVRCDECANLRGDVCRAFSLKYTQYTPLLYLPVQQWRRCNLYRGRATE